MSDSLMEDLEASLMALAVAVPSDSEKSAVVIERHLITNTAFASLNTIGDEISLSLSLNAFL